ncbi:acyl-coenzyme A synthetase/AMP-(fatty) acid ligase [Paraburkholderia sp. MM5496-R1]
MAIIDFFDRGWRINPNGVAYIQDERSYSFSEVHTLSCRIANGLLSAGFEKEAKAAVWADNDVTAWTCTLGLWRAGVVWIPVNGRTAPQENQYVLDAFDCEALFFHQAFAPAIEALRPSLPRGSGSGSVSMPICRGRRRSRNGARRSPRPNRASITTWTTS